MDSNQERLLCRKRGLADISPSEGLLRHSAQASFVRLACISLFQRLFYLIAVCVVFLFVFVMRSSLVCLLFSMLCLLARSDCFVSDIFLCVFACAVLLVFGFWRSKMRALAAQGAEPCPNEIPSDLLAANCIPPGFMVQTGWDIVCDYYQARARQSGIALQSIICPTCAVL